MKVVLEYLEKNALENKEKTAVTYEDNECSYFELLELSRKVGSSLSSKLLFRKPVPVLMEKGINALSCFFGAAYAGGFYVLLNPELPIVRLKKILDILDTNFLVTDREHIDFAKENFSDKEILDVESLQNGKIDKEGLKKIRSMALDTDPLYANFTSGSTGEPKGVLVSHRSVIDFIDAFTEKFGISKNDIIGNQAPFDFDVSVKDIYSSIKTGATLAIIPKKLFSAPAKLLDYICEKNVTTLIWAVSALCLITTFHGLDYKVPSSVNKVLFSGEVMPLKHMKEWIKHLPDATFVNLYGPTEITCNCTYHVVDKELKYEAQIPIGKAFDNEEVFLLNEDDKKIDKQMEKGEICVKGSCLALGYYNNPNMTNDRFVQNPLNDKYIDYIYRTGDMGFLDQNYDFCFCGRKDFQIKHMGHRIELEEIERAMENVSGVDRACCIYKEEKSRILGFFVGSVSKEELHNELKNVLPVYMIPNSLNLIEAMPMTKNGKIDRKALV